VSLANPFVYNPPPPFTCSLDVPLRYHSIPSRHLDCPASPMSISLHPTHYSWSSSNQPSTPAAQVPYPGTQPQTLFLHSLLWQIPSRTYTDFFRPAKKRCQYKVVYNIPTLPKADSPKSDASALPPSTDGTAAPSSPKPEMTANPTQCPSAALRVAGDCPHCSRVFCGTHRTPESHNW
jgi:hypothetical protein